MKPIDVAFVVVVLGLFFVGAWQLLRSPLSDRVARRAAIAASVCTAALIPLTAVVARGTTGRLDQRLSHWAFEQARSRTWLDHASDLLAKVGGTGVMLAVAAVAIGWLWFTHHRPQASFLAMSAVLGVATTSALKYAVGRNRPPTVGELATASSPSYPSGHTSAAVYVVVALCVVAYLASSSRWRWTILAAGVVYAMVMAFSRVALGVHWPTDVVGGWLVGAMALLISLAYWRPRGVREVTPA